MSDKTANTKNRSLLDILNEYKEILAICAFFFAGVFWIFAYFATKQQLDDERVATKRQFKAQQCLLNTNLDFLQGKIDAANLSGLLVKNVIQSKALAEKRTLTAIERETKDDLQRAANDLARKVAAAENATAEALKKIRNGECVDTSN